MAATNIQIILELGHTAYYRPNGAKDANQTTHDWVAYVRGENGADISGFIRKVVFHLHSTFSDPRRSIEKAPFEVRESGYAGFMMPIEVYFNKPGDNQPQKIRFDYDLSIFPDESCNCMQTEKVTFQNPPFDFRIKLLDGGGSGLLESDAAALLPGRKLKQQYDHSRSRGLDRVPRLPGWSIPSFDEFAELFGLKLAKSIRPSITSQDGANYPPTDRSKPTNSAASSKKVTVKPLPPISTSTSTLAKTKSGKSDSLLSAALAKKSTDKPASSSVTSDSNRAVTAVKSSAANEPSAKPVAATQRIKAVSARNLNTPPANAGHLSVSPSSLRGSSSMDALTSKIKAHTGVPRTPMSPLSPAADDDDRTSRSRSRSSDDSPYGRTDHPDAIRRGSAGFLLPTVNQKIASKEIPHLEHVNGKPLLSEPSDDDDSEPEPILKSKRKKEKVSDYRDSRNPTVRPVSLSTDDDREESKSDSFFGKIPPKILSEADELNRFRLQVLCSQLTDRAVIQGIVDVLEPLGAFIIDRKTKMFSFNLYMLDDATVEVIKKLADFDKYIFEES